MGEALKPSPALRQRPQGTSVGPKGPSVMTYRTIAFFVGLLSSRELLACTLCHSSLAELVRERFFGTDFPANLAGIVLPPLILFAAIYYAARSGPASRSDK